MTSLSDVLLVILGWLLGTLTPGIADAIKRPKRKADLLTGFRVDVFDLRYKMAVVAHLARSETSTYDAPSLAILKPVLTLPPTGDAVDSALGERFTQLLASGDSTFIAMYNARSSAPGMYPMPYTLPFLDAHLGELSVLSLQSQRAILRIKAELELFNQQVAYVRACHDRSFTLAGENHRLNANNFREAVVKLAVRAECCVVASNALLDKR